MARADLTVRGAGIFGLSIAWAAARQGARVRVIDPSGVGAGSSGGVVGALSPHVPEAWNPKKAFQLESLLLADGWWAAVEAAAGLSSGYGRLGRLQPLADAAAVDLARARAAGAEKLWQGRAEWRVVPATGGAWEPASPSGWLVEDTLSARIAPRMALQALVQAITAQGGEVLREGEEAGPVVHATGFAGWRRCRWRLGARSGPG
jgi:glycine oxidase